jgi:Rod binding domain-containing protein
MKIMAAFNPTSDVVVDVMKAADPAKASLAVERLAALAASAPAGDFAASLNEAAAAAAPSAQPGLANARASLAAAADSSDPAARAKVEFEAMMLNSFIGDMLPKESAALFGQGAAGDIWRSMLSEQISRQIAKSGALGLSRRLFATHDMALRVGAERSALSSDAAQMSANALAAPAAADITNSAILTAARRRA